jgi:hypothetical protein
VRASRTPIIAPSITIQMKRKRAISSVQIQRDQAVERAIICSVTGTTSRRRWRRAAVEQPVVPSMSLRMCAFARSARAKKSGGPAGPPPDR